MTTTTTPLAPTPTSAREASWAPLAVLMTGTFIFVLDFFVVNVALPAIRSDLGAGQAAIEWVVAGYGLTTSVLLITGGRLGDRFGRRRVFAAGLALFVATSAACGLAQDPAMLVAARLAQGAGAALMAPNIMSIIGVLYTGPRRVRAISVYGMVMGLAAVSGQLIGGVLIHADVAGLGWRAVFWINVPVGVAALLALRIIPESLAQHRQRVDLAGVGLITMALLAVLLPLVQGRQLGWPAWSFGCLLVAPLLLWAFWAAQHRLSRRGGAPLLDPAVFASRGLRAGLATQVVFWCQQAATYLFLALFLQQGRGVSALTSGAIFAVLAAGYLLTSLRAPALTIRFGRSVVLAGSLAAAAGDLLLAGAVLDHGTGGPVALLFPGLLLLGAGQGLCITPLTTTVLAHLDPSSAGSVSGVLSTAQQVGNSLGVALVGLAFFGLLGHGYGPAFAVSTLAMAAVLLVVAALSRLLPGGVRSADRLPQQVPAGRDGDRG